MEIYLVMELQNSNLLKVIKDRESNLGCDNISFITYQMLCGIDYLHKCGIIHRVS